MDTLGKILQSLGKRGPSVACPDTTTPSKPRLRAIYGVLGLDLNFRVTEERIPWSTGFYSIPAQVMVNPTLV